MSGDDQSREEFLAKAARLIATHHLAEKTIRYQHALLAADDEDDSDVDDEPVWAGERSLVIGRDHPAWAEVDAEQRERLGENDERVTP